MADKDRKFLLSKKEIVVLSIISILLLLTPILYTQVYSGVGFGNASSAQIGDTIGGVTAPFIGLLGSILVYIAFKAQYRANQDIQQQFKQQNDDQLFFRMIDGLTHKISAHEVKIEADVFSSHQSLSRMAIQVKTTLGFYAEQINKELFIEEPTAFDDEFYQHLFSKIPMTRILVFTTWEQFRSTFIKSSIEERNRIFTMLFDKTTPVTFHLLGHNIYDIPFKFRERFYPKAFDKVYEDNAGFFDGYFSNIYYILRFINSKNEEFYLEYFFHNLTSFEKVFIFYYCATRRSDVFFQMLVEQFRIIEDIDYKLLFGISDQDTMNKELQYIFEKREPKSTYRRSFSATDIMNARRN